jgi:hypothetical protein
MANTCIRPHEAATGQLDINDTLIKFRTSLAADRAERISAFLSSVWPR